jgi:CO dehydrogenase/acetyl-CoA synthase alpha subunit
MAIAGGAPGGRLVERATAIEDVGSMLLVLPARHEVVRRLRTPTADWLVRAVSTCEGCRLCSDACPDGVRAHELLWTLATGRDDGLDLLQAASCSGCGVCDVQCPSALSPLRLVTEIRDRLGLRAPRVPVRAGGLDLELLTLRLGLSMYAMPQSVR